MIGCMIVLQVLAVTEFRYMEFETANLLEAQRLAALEAGRIGGAHSSGHDTPFGFECDGKGWISVGLAESDAFGRSSRKIASKG